MPRFGPDGRWNASAGEFAVRIRGRSLPGILSKNLLVDSGIRAVLIEDGQIAGELEPGVYMLDTLAERLSLEPRPQTAVVLVRGEETPIELAKVVVCTRDGQSARVGLRVRLRVDDATAFLENALGSRDKLGIGELRSLLAPALVQDLKKAVGRMTWDELRKTDSARRLATAMDEEGATLHYYGFRLGPIVDVDPEGPPGEPTDAAAAPDEPTDATGESAPPPESHRRARRSGRRILRYPAAESNTEEPQPTAETRLAGGLARRSGQDARQDNDVSRISTAHEPPRLAPAAGSSIVVNSLGMQLALLPPGRFLMGSPTDEPDRGPAEDQHRVEISRPFYLGVVPVVQDEYRRIMGADPSCFAEPQTAEGPGEPQRRLPVERVSWDDAREFCRRLSERPEEQAAGRSYRLPTEAEWECACRAGTTSAFAFGPSLGPADANFDVRPSHGAEGVARFAGGTTPVASYRPNAWGLYDMHGNVWEWCEDWFSPDYYAHSPGQDPQGPATGFARVLRGGGWRSRAAQCRAAARWSATATQRHDAFGFRVACEIR